MKQQQRESILKLLELKNEQSFYIKQRQGKKIINFLKSLPISQIQEFNNYNTNSFSELSIEMSYFAIKKQIKLIHIIYETDGIIKNKSLFDKNLELPNPKLFAEIIGDIAVDNATDKFYNAYSIGDVYNVNKAMTKEDVEFEHNLLLEFDKENFKNNLFNWITKHFNNKIKRSNNLGILLNFISNLNEYDILFMINNHVNKYKPFINCLYLFENDNELNMIKEHILDQLYYYVNCNTLDSRLANYKEMKLSSDNVDKLFESIQNH